MRRASAAVLLFCAALAAGAGSARALTLADLQAGESFTQEGVVYENFDVKVLGRGLSRDLSRYEVIPGPCGFMITGDAAVGNGGDGRLRIRYDVSTTEEGGLLASSVSVFGGSDPETMVKNRRRIFDDGDRVAALFAKPMPGMDFLQVELDGLGSVRVIDTIRVWGRFADGANVTSRYLTADCIIPEPGTALLLASGLLGLASGAARRRGRATGRAA